MFVILKVEQTEKRRIKKAKTVSNVRFVNMGSGQCFYEVEVISGERGVNWHEVSSFIGNHGKNVLLPENTIIPEAAPVRRFCANKFKNILIFNTLELVLRELFFLGNRIKCVVNDPDGLYSAEIEKIVKYAARTTVVTNNEFRYFTQIRAIYSHYGAGITLTDSLDVTQDDTVIIDTTGELGKVRGVLFSPVGGMKPMIVDGFDHIKAYCPPYIDQLDFMGAIFEMNRNAGLGDAFCRSFVCENTKYTVYETAKMIAGIKDGESINKSIIFYV